MIEKQNQFVEWGVAAQAIRGETESGDQYLVKSFDNGVLVAVVDGLGHGEQAAIAAKTAIATLEQYTHEPVDSLIERCHADLLKTRGVVMSLASFNATDCTMTWMGIGNVRGVLLKEDMDTNPDAEREEVPLRGGVVGYRLPSLRPGAISLERGDTLILATDGIRSSFAQGLDLNKNPQELADDIFERYSKERDDSLVLVTRWSCQV